MTIPAISKRSSPTKAPHSSTWRFCGRTGGCGFGVSPNATSIEACRVREHTERGGELRERRCCLERPEREQLHRDAEDDDDGERDHECGRGRDVRAEEARSQGPVGVAGEHGDAAACEVDHARPAVEEDDGERDAGDQRTDAQAEQSELPDLLDLVHAQGRSLIRSRRARLESRARCSTSTREVLAVLLSGWLEPARDPLELSCS